MTKVVSRSQASVEERKSSTKVVNERVVAYQLKKVIMDNHQTCHGNCSSYPTEHYKNSPDEYHKRSSLMDVQTKERAPAMESYSFG